MNPSLHHCFLKCVMRPFVGRQGTKVSDHTVEKLCPVHFFFRLVYIKKEVSLWQQHVFNTADTWTFFFYWSIVALQYCVGFHCTAKWISSCCSVTLSSLTLCHPVGCSAPGLLPTEVTKERWVESPELCSRLPLGIHSVHSSVYTSVPISQFIPPSLPSLVSLHLFSTPVSIHMNLFAKQK